MADLIRVSIMGSMPNGEEWSVNPVYSIGGDFGEPVSAVEAQQIATAIAARAVGADLLALNPAVVTVNRIRVEARTVAGDLESLGEAALSTPAAGTSTTSHGYSAATVFSLRTALPGASGRGRLYWPATGILMSNITLRVSPAVTTPALAALKTYLSGIDTDITTVLSGAVSLCVWSRKLASLTAVNAIQMGDILDVQRRRRDALVETYVSTTFP